MNAAFAPIAERYHYLNQYASQGQIIFFGSSYLDQFPIYELKEDYGMDQTIFKRTIPGLKIEDAFALLDSCVFDLMPSKLFLCFGDDDAESPSFSLSDFMNQYRKLVVRLQIRCQNARSICSALPEQIVSSKLAKRFKRWLMNTGVNTFHSVQRRPLPMWRISDILKYSYIQNSFAFPMHGV